MAGYQLSSHLLSLAAGRQVVESNVLRDLLQTAYNFSGVLKQEMNRSWDKDQNVKLGYKLDDLGLL